MTTVAVTTDHEGDGLRRGGEGTVNIAVGGLHASCSNRVDNTVVGAMRGAGKYHR